MKRVGIMIFIFCLMSFFNGILAQTVTLPDDPHSAYKLMSKYEDDKKYLEAYEVCRQAVEKWPDLEHFKNNKAYYLELMGRDDEAKVILEPMKKSGSTGERRSYAWAGLSRLAGKAGDTENALTYAKKANSLRTTYVTLFTLSEAYRQIGQYKDAIKNYKKAASYVIGYYSDKLSETRSRAECHYAMSICYLHLGETQEAKELFEKAKKVNPECFSYYAYYALLGEASSAAKNLDEFLQCNEKYTRIKTFKEIDKDFMKDLGKVKDAPEWQAVIKKWTASN